MTNLLIHKVIEGPFYSEEEGAWGLIVCGQDEGNDHMFQDCVFTEDEDNAWAIVRWLNKSIMPWVMEFDDTPEEGRLGSD